MRKGEGNDLSGIGWIGQNLLIPGDRRVEDHLAHGLTGRTDTPPPKDGSISKNDSSGRPGRAV